MHLPKISRTAYLHIAVLACSLIFGAAMAIHLGQDLNWDLLNYHFYNPYAFLHHRLTQDIAPAQFQTYNNPLIDLPGYLLIRHFRPVIAAMALGALQGVNIWLVFEVTLKLLKRSIKEYPYRFAVAVGVAAFSLFGAAFVSELGNTMGDSLSSIGVLAGLLLLLMSIDRTISPKRAVKLRLAAYFIVGMVIGLKLTNAMYGVALLLAGLAIEGSYRKKAKHALMHGALLVTGMLVTSGFWYVRMWQLFKNPIFPYFNGIFKSPNYAPINFVDDRWFPKTFLGKIFYPFRFARLQNAAAEVPFRDPRFAVLFALAITAILILGFRKFILKRQLKLASYSGENWAFWIFLLAAYLVWVKQFSYYRYLLGIELLVLPAIALIAYTMIKNKRLATALLASLFSLITYFTVPINWGRIPWQPNYFGTNLTQQLGTVKGTVLLAGGNPISYLVPYLPQNTTVVRVASNLTSPAAGTQAEQALIRNRIELSKNRGTSFYAIETSDLQTYELEQLKEFGFKNDTCQTIDTYAGRYLFFKTIQYKLCYLKPAS